MVYVLEYTKSVDCIPILSIGVSIESVARTEPKTGSGKAIALTTAQQSCMRTLMRTIDSKGRTIRQGDRSGRAEKFIQTKKSEKMQPGGKKTIYNKQDPSTAEISPAPPPTLHLSNGLSLTILYTLPAGISMRSYAVQVYSKKEVARHSIALHLRILTIHKAYK
jgi:hypothetical protein